MGQRIESLGKDDNGPVLARFADAELRETAEVQAALLPKATR